MSISWPLERSKDERALASMSTAEKYKLRFAEWGTLILMSVVVAISASFVSLATTWLAMLRQGYCKQHWYLAHHVCDEAYWSDWPKSIGWFLYLLFALLYNIPVAILVRLAPSSAYSGIAELQSFFQGFATSRFLDWKTLIVRLFGVGLVSASGLWLGQEAPLAHISAAITSILSSVLPISEARRRDLVQASTAAGISVAFSAPLGGVLFGMETFMPSKAVMWKMFVCSMVATVLLRTLVAPSSASGGIVVPETGLFHVSFDRIWHAVELVPFAILGIIGGIYGAILPKMAALMKRLYISYPVSSVAAVTTITALLSYATVVSRIPLFELLVNLFSECRQDDPDSLFCADSQQIFGLMYTFALGALLLPISCTLPIPSGILFPSIVLGALCGRLMGLGMGAILEKLPGVLSTSFCPDSSQHCITPGAYALVGAGAFLTGITRLTVSAAFLMFEITGALSFVIPIMTGVIVSKWVSDLFSEASNIYQFWAGESNVPIFSDSSRPVADLYASEIMIPRDSVVAISYTSESSSARTLLSSPYRSVPILGKNNELIDFVLAKSGQTEPTMILSPKASLFLIQNAIVQLGIRVVLICSGNEFKGLLTRRDVVNAAKTPRITITQADADEFEIESD